MNWLLGRIVLEIAMICSMRTLLSNDLAVELLSAKRPCEKCGTLLAHDNITCGGCGNPIGSGVLVALAALLVIFGLVVVMVKLQELVHQLLGPWGWR